MNKKFLIAGVDEVGRGPLAGPVLAAAVILDFQQPIIGIKNSKKLSATKREKLSEEIKKKAIAWSIGRAEVEEIDRLNILQATLLAMCRAVEQLSIKPEKILVDGRDLPKWNYTSEAIIKGDDSVLEISAASIIAKVARDKEMKKFHEIYPHYGFANHVGYGTAEHLAALQKWGPCLIHRTSFSPVRTATLIA